MTGKKEGFANELKEGVDFEVTKRTENILGKKKTTSGFIHPPHLHCVFHPQIFFLKFLISWIVL